MPPERHPVITNQRIVDKILARRGRLHAFEHIDPNSTCLVVIDMMLASIEMDERLSPTIPDINKLATKLRASGGTIAWVTAKSKELPKLHVSVFGHETAKLFHKRAQPDDPRSYLPETLIVHKEDLHAQKEGFSAFFPERCDLHDQLHQRQIDTVFICGTVTNICCESSARDAVELGYQTILVADLCVGHTDGLHEAALTTFYRTFGDVRLSSELEDMI